MAVNLSPVGGVAAQFFDNSGNVLTGGKLLTYAAGTTTPQITYTTSAGNIPQPNPIILNASGRVPGSGEIWLTDGVLYKFVLTDSNDVLIATYDNISGINSNFVAFTNQQEIQTATAGQTVFNLTTTQYQPGTNSLSVFVDGVNQYGPGAQYAYIETDQDTVTFVNGLHVGALVKFTTSQLNSSGGSQTAAQTSFTGFKGQVGNVQNLADDDGSDWIGFESAGSGAVAISAQDKMRQFVSVKDFGAVGDGVTNDTTAITNALAYLSSVDGGVLLFGRGETYLLTEEMSVTNSVEIELNGSTLNFACVGAKRLLAVDGSNVQVRNGTISNTVGSTGFEGTYQTPIVVGQYTVLAGVSNVVLENLTISTVLAQGNGIAIFGDSHDITIQNITYPDSDKIGIPVLAHWSFDGGPTGPYLGETTHPHNITIDNIRCGDLTYDAGGGTFGTSVVFLSAVYNINVSNVYVKSIPHGKICTVYAGDWGFQFGTALEQALGSTGISINNLYGQALVGIDTYMLNPLEAPSVIWPASISIKNMGVYGYGSTNSSSKGINIDVTDNVSVEDCVIRNAYYGAQVGAGTNVKIRNSIIKNNARQGFIKVGTGGSSNVEISNCRFESNNTDDAANIADILLVSMSQVSVFENVFVSPTSIWNVRAENTVTGLRCVDNHVVDVKLTDGPCFSLGDTTETNICVEFEGNTSAVSPTNGIRGGQYMIPMVFSARHGQNTLQRVAYYNTVPDRGTWAIGDRVYNDTPVIGQPKSWVCTVAGTPGTWVSEGNL
jgi:polygalacturonase